MVDETEENPRRTDKIMKNMGRIDLEPDSLHFNY
jgi:hypothetical protein